MIALYKEEFIEVGYIRKGHGFKGHAKIVMYDGLESVLTDQSFVFIEIDGYKVPFFIEDRQVTKELILKFEFIDSVEALRQFQRSSIYLLKKTVPQHHSAHEEIQGKAMIGFMIKDARLGEVGSIIRIDSYPQQLMAVVNHKDKEILIPLHPDLIEEVSEIKRCIHMHLPEGLLDV